MKTYLTESESLDLFGPETDEEKERHELSIKQTIYTLEQLRNETRNTGIHEDDIQSIAS